MSVQSRALPRVLAVLLLLGATGLIHKALAQNENEQIGFSSTHVFSGDYFGETVDILNGNLILTVPIGPAYQASETLSYQLVLTYNSKVWLERKPSIYRDDPILVTQNEQEWEANLAEQDPEMGGVHVHSAGLGFRLLMGRVFYAQPQLDPFSDPEAALDPGWYYQDQAGTNHPLIYCPEAYDMPIFPSRSDPDDKHACGSVNYYETTDTTYMKAEKIFGAAGAQIGWAVYPGDGRKLTFRHQPHPGVDPKTDPEPEDLRGFYLTRIEGIEKKYLGTNSDGDAIVEPYVYVDIVYETEPGLRHSISRIEEYRLDPDAGGATPLPTRVITFEHVSTLSAGGQNVTVHGGLVRRVHLPAFGGSVATYDFEYVVRDVSVPSRLFICTQDCIAGIDGVFPSVPLLGRLVFPATGPSATRTRMEFSYDDDVAATQTHGELTERRLPTGAIIQYEYGYYDYGRWYVATFPTPGCDKCGGAVTSQDEFTETRHVISKVLHLDGSSYAQYQECLASSGEESCGVTRWRYVRNGDLPVTSGGQQVSPTPTRVHVYDPDGNETIHYFKASNEVWDLHLNGLNYRTDTYAGTSQNGKLVRSELSYYQAWRFCSECLRVNIQRVQREVRFADDGSPIGKSSSYSEASVFDRLGHEVTRVELDMEPFGKIRSMRTWAQKWKQFDELTEFEKQNWSIHKLQRTRVYSGVGTIHSESRFEYTEEGKLRKKTRLARPGKGLTAGEDLETIYCYGGDDLVGTIPVTGEIYPYFDPSAADSGCSVEPNPDLIRSGNLILTKTSGGATEAEPSPPLREVEYKYQAGGYLAGKRYRENGQPMAWWEFERDRDLNTGLITETRDSSGTRTNFSYDALGRVERVDPDSFTGTNAAREFRSEVRYPSMTRAVLIQGSDSLLQNIPYDAANACALAGDFKCSEFLYDGLGRIVETRERRKDASAPAVQYRRYTGKGFLSAMTEWVSSGTSYADAPKTLYDYSSYGTSFTDPLGRAWQVITATGDVTGFEFSGSRTTIRSHGLNRRSGASAGETVTQIEMRDAFDRLIAVDSETGADAIYKYDPSDRLVEAILGELDTSLTLVAGSGIQRRVYTYDHLGRLIEEVHPEKGRTLYLGFEPGGNVTLLEDARGVRLRRTYDGANRLLREELWGLIGKGRNLGWLPLMVNTYDTGQFGPLPDRIMGRLTRTVSYNDQGTAVAERKLRYAGLNGRLDQEDVWIQFLGWRSTTFEYNGFGLLQTIHYPGDPSWSAPLKANYSYMNGYLTSVRTENATRNLEAANLQYNPAGLLRSWDAGNGTRTTIEPDSRNRPRRIFVDRMPETSLSARVPDPEAGDASFLHRLAALHPAPHHWVGGDNKRGKPPGNGGPGGGGLGPEEDSATCHDGEDNDGNGLTDCSDAKCYDYCNENLFSLCYDGIDNDLNGFTDCADPGCGFFCVEESYSRCHDGQDNDTDGLLDCADPDCAIPCTPEESFEACTDGADNNANGLVDCSENPEPSCVTYFCGPLMSAESSFETCTDRLDNDRDTFFDCADVDCTNCQLNPGLCGPEGFPLACRLWDSGLYEYDGLGNVASIGATDVYTYDRANRLVRAELGSADWNWMTYGYDIFGNMTSWEKGAGNITTVIRTFEMDTATNRILSSSMNSGSVEPFQYDAAGNLLRDHRYLYDYDSRNRLVLIRSLDGSQVVSSFSYDSKGFRTRKEQDGKKTFYVRDSNGRVLTEFELLDGASLPQWRRAYVYAAEQQVGMLKPSNQGDREISAPARVAGRVMQVTWGGPWVIGVYWTPSNLEQIQGYLLYRRTETSGWALLATSPLSGNEYYDDWDLESGETYYYAVEVMDTWGNRSALSAEARVPYVLEGDPLEPVWVDPYIVANQDSITVHWGLPAPDPVSVGFTLARYSSPDGIAPYSWERFLNESVGSVFSQLIFPFPGPEYTDSADLVPGRWYKYTICNLGRLPKGGGVSATCTPIDLNNNELAVYYAGPPSSEPPPEGTVPPEIGKLQTPAAFQAIADPESPDTIHLAWLMVGQQEVASYRVYREIQGSGGTPLLSPFTDFPDPGSTSFTLDATHGVVPGTLYRFRLAATGSDNVETPASNLSETRTRSSTVGVPQFTIEKTVCYPGPLLELNDCEHRGFCLEECSPHGHMFQNGAFYFSVTDGVVLRSGDADSRYAFRLYFRACGDPSECATKPWVAAGRRAGGSSFAGGGALGRISGLFSTDFEYWKMDDETDQPLVYPIPNPSYHCKDITDPDSYVCGNIWYWPHGCQRGQYALSTVRGRIDVKVPPDMGLFIEEEESLLSEPVFYDPYELFRDIPLFDPTETPENQFQVRHRSYSTCTVKAAGIGSDGHLKGVDILHPCGEDQDPIQKLYNIPAMTLGYRVWWAPVPYCGVKGYNVYMLRDCDQPGCGKGALGQLALETEDLNFNNVLDTGTCSDTGAACVNDFDCSGFFLCGEGLCEGEEDLNCNRVLDGELIKLNSDLITGNHFDIYPPLTDDYCYDGDGSNIPRYVVVETVLDPAISHPNFDPALDWRDRFSCPLNIGTTNNGEPYGVCQEQGKKVLDCTSNSPGSETNGGCWCGNLVFTSGGCYVADRIVDEDTNTVYYYGSGCGLSTSEGQLIEREIWSSLEPSDDALPGRSLRAPGCAGFHLADSSANPIPSPEPPPDMIAPGRPGAAAVVGIARWVPSGPSVEASPYRAVGSAPMPPNEVVYYHTDHLGSVRLTTDSRGMKIREAVYWPFGDESLPAAWDENTHRFTGHERDIVTGLDYMLARYYRPAMARFLSPDPDMESMRLARPQTWNRFSYAANNPLRYIDRTGENLRPSFTFKMDPWAKKAYDEVHLSDYAMRHVIDPPLMTIDLIVAETILGGQRSGQDVYISGITRFSSKTSAQIMLARKDGQGNRYSYQASLETLAHELGHVIDISQMTDEEYEKWEAACKADEESADCERQKQADEHGGEILREIEHQRKLQSNAAEHGAVDSHFQRMMDWIRQVCSENRFC